MHHKDQKPNPFKWICSQMYTWPLQLHHACGPTGVNLVGPTRANLVAAVAYMALCAAGEQVANTAPSSLAQCALGTFFTLNDPSAPPQNRLFIKEALTCTANYLATHFVNFFYSVKVR